MPSGVQFFYCPTPSKIKPINGLSVCLLEQQLRIFSSNLLWFLASKLVLLQRLLQASSCSPPLTSTSRTNKAIRAIWTNNFISDTFYLVLPVSWLRGPLWPNWCTDLLATNISCNFAMQYQWFFLGIFRHAWQDSWSRTPFDVNALGVKALQF